MFMMVQAGLCQQRGKQTKEDTLDFSFAKCTTLGGCKKEKGGITLDSNWRWTHKYNDYKNCYTGNTWDKTLCPNDQQCTKNCALDGVDAKTWKNTYGVHITDGDTMQLDFVTQGPYSKNIGSRTYLLDSSKEKYEMFNLLNQEFTFDVDVSNLPCGLNGALYFVGMEADGGMGEHPTNKCGAKYGTGYCDAQCPRDMKWINGEANVEGWKPSPNDANAGTGKYGSCCVEMDIWEANSMTQAFTTHPCKKEHQFRCEGIDCGIDEQGHRYDGVCDKDGCDFASWRMGDHTFYGPGDNFKVNTKKPMTVVTQFFTNDNSSDGELIEIRRLYVQEGNVISNSKFNFDGTDIKPYDSITTDFCGDIKDFFGDINYHDQVGGLKKLGEEMKAGMVLVMSLWDDHSAHMLWLDSTYPVDADKDKPGVNRGPCSTDSGKPEQVESRYAHSTVKFGKVRVGDIHSTY